MNLLKGKKLIAVILSLILVAVVASCAPSGRDTAATTTTEAEETTTTEAEETTTTEAEETTTTEAEETTTTEAEETTTTEAEEEETTADEDEDDADAATAAGAALAATTAKDADDDADSDADVDADEDADVDADEDADADEDVDEDVDEDEDTDEDKDKDKDDDKKRVIRIGVVGEANEPWEAAMENLEDVDFEIELVRFSEYILPNAALAEGEIELNSFQHRMFLENEIESEGYEIEEIGVTILAPLTIYSEEYDSIEDIPEDGIIAIPSDPTNGGRALKLLEAAGLITVDPEVGYFGTEADITDNPLNLEILAVEASMTAQSLPDVAAAIINGHHASTHGLSPEHDGLFTEEIDDDPDNPFINIIVARSDEVDDEDYQKIVEAFQQPNVAEVILEAYKGTQIPAWPDALEEDEDADAEADDADAEADDADADEDTDEEADSDS